MVLYDMHGNVLELCLDRMTITNEYTKAFPPDYGARGMVVDPIGGELSSWVRHPAGAYYDNQTIRRGGALNTATDKIAEIRSAYRGGGTYSAATKMKEPSGEETMSYNGARLCLPARFK